MPRQGNVISFDDAKRSSAAARRSRSASSNGSRSSRESREIRDSRPSRSSRSSRGFDDYSRVDLNARSSRQRSAFERMSQADGFFESESFGRSSRSDRSSRANRSERSERKGRGSRAAVTTFAPVAKDRAQEKEEKRRSRNKARADRMFDRQFDGASSNASGGEGGPRAAVYRGEMGAKQRKANRLQNRGAGSSSASGVSPKCDASAVLSVFAGLFSSRIAVVCATVLVGVALVCGLLYPTAKEYYLSIREHDQIQAEFEAVSQRNGILVSKVAELSTDDGIKQQAHERYGLIEPGDETGVLVGGTLESEKISMDVDASIPEGSVPAPKTWYSDFLDAFFGVK